MRYIYIVIKRIIDFIAALLFLIILSPVFLIVSIAIKLDSKGPVIFKQKRVGKKGKIFNLYKFRSMSASNNPLNFKEENQITKVGHFIRKWSIDELPQLVNIIKGDMAFIGPRPWMVEYHEYMTEEQKHRSDVLPGITGYAQTKGRNNISILNKINLDLEYVRKLSLWMDIKIIFLTIATVFSRDGAEMTKMGMKKEIDDIRDNYFKEQEKNKKKK